MKKLIISLLFTVLAAMPIYSQLEVGKKAPEWKFPDADKKEFTMASWNGKVLQVNYVDPDEKDLNDPFNDAVKKAGDDKRINRDLFKGFGITDCKSTGIPDFLIRAAGAKKEKRFNTTVLYDYDAKLQTLWGLPKDNYSVVIIDKNRICRAIYKGKIPDSEIEKAIQLIIQLTKE